MLAIVFDGNDDRSISEYSYETSDAPAFTDSIWLPDVLQSLTTNPPTSLSQVYYNCTISRSMAAIQALGIANANAHLFTLVGFTLLCMIVIRYANSKLPPDQQIATKTDKTIRAARDQVQQRVALEAVVNYIKQSGQQGTPEFDSFLQSTEGLFEPKGPDSAIVTSNLFGAASSKCTCTSSHDLPLGLFAPSLA